MKNDAEHWHANRPKWHQLVVDATLELRSQSHDSSQRLLARLWLRDVRKTQKLTLADIECRTAALGPESCVSRSVLSHLERGRAAFDNLGPHRSEALRLTLGIPLDVWNLKVSGHLPHKRRKKKVH